MRIDRLFAILIGVILGIATQSASERISRRLDDREAKRVESIRAIVREEIAAANKGNASVPASVQTLGGCGMIGCTVYHGDPVTQLKVEGILSEKIIQDSVISSAVILPGSIELGDFSGRVR